LTIGANARQDRALPHRAVSDAPDQPLLFAVFTRDSHNDCAKSLLYFLFASLLVLPPPEIKNSERPGRDRVLEMAQVPALDFFMETSS
jgi:hypothetical protein